ncbi:relaxase/mobilization nuclease domain-containing protein [Rhizobium leguminosarum]|uniref:relaxase/mobilization nuclease domain-containing protein n=1 Tax=Rhizobium leguminosarum TaxID=384 RepID=UPI001C96055A|nr:relaxase/mobilization nuclease domain-containing protein [Rhizobium leguminosarum]MBY5775226.1 relaxase/mobilization nuclease domain-containing protein [Rhizobium leguminosarum]
MISEARQAIVHIPRKGGCKSIKRICKQLRYLDQHEEVAIQLSERHGGGLMSRREYEDWATRWAEQTGHYLNGESLYDGEQDLTTHIIASFPPGTDAEAAYAAGRDFAEDAFGSGENGGEWDYVTAFHTNRPHPHVHIIVNRRSLAARAEWLSISHRNRFLNYDTFREKFAKASLKQGIELDATSREQRGLQGRGPSTTEYRRRARIEFHIHHEDHYEVVDLAQSGQQEVFPELAPRRPVGDDGGGADTGLANISPPVPNPVSVERRREAEVALSDHRRQRRIRHAIAEVEAGPSFRLLPDPEHRPRKVDFNEAPSSPSDLHYDALAARQLQEEWVQAETSSSSLDGIAPDNRVPDNQQSLPFGGPSNETFDIETPGAEEYVLEGSDDRSLPSTEECEIEDQLKREIAEYREKQLKASRSKWEIDEVAAGPGRRRTPAGTIETRGEQIRRRSAARAANRERNRALKEPTTVPNKFQADAAATAASAEQTINTGRKQPALDASPSSGHVNPAVAPDTVRPIEDKRTDRGRAGSREPMRGRDRGRTR